MSVASDIRAIRALALDVWRGLTDAQRATMRRSVPLRVGVVCIGRPRTLSALTRIGLVSEGGIATPLGLLVRDVGREQEAADARARYQTREGKP